MSSMPKCRVTLPRKRYTVERVFVCIGCDLLTSSTRAHAITCSGACRVHVHRHPEELRELESRCTGMRVSVPAVLDMKAANRLLPELDPRIMRGEITLDDVRLEIWQAFARLLFGEQASR